MTREEAIRIFKKEIECMSHTKCSDCRLKNVCDPISTTPLDSEYIVAFSMAIEALSAEPCEDTISRAAAIIAMDDLEQEDIERYSCSIPEGFDGKRAIEALQKLPSVTPKQKMGRWKVASDGYGDNAYICECSECKDTVWVYKDADRKWNYCPNCGAKMVEHRKVRTE